MERVANMKGFRYKGINGPTCINVEKKNNFKFTPVILKPVDKPTHTILLCCEHRVVPRI